MSICLTQLVLFHHIRLHYAPSKYCYQHCPLSLAARSELKLNGLKSDLPPGYSSLSVSRGKLDPNSFRDPLLQNSVGIANKL